MQRNMHAYPRGAFGDGIRCLDEFGRQGFRGDELFWPNFCDISNTGDIAIADTDNNRIQVFQAQQYTSIFPPFGGKGTDQNSLNRPMSVKFSSIPGSNLIVADTGNKRICLLRINFALGKLETSATFGSTHLVEPTDMAVDRRNGNIVVVDTALNQVMIFSHAGEYLGNLEQRGFNFKHPSSVVITHDGLSDIYVSDTGNNCVRRFTCSGDYVGVMGTLGAAEGQFDNPKGNVNHDCLELSS